MGEHRRNTTEVGGSNPSPLTNWIKITWSQELGLPECPYMKRWVVECLGFSVRVHRWQSSDDDRAHHDHPWWFLTLVLRGSYVDESPEGDDLVRAGRMRFRRAQHKHTVRVLQPGTWTVLVTGRPLRRWGFWVRGRMMRRDRYFAMMGHHPCDSGGEPVRFRPDKTRIG